MMAYTFLFIQFNQLLTNSYYNTTRTAVIFMIKNVTGFIAGVI